MVEYAPIQMGVGSPSLSELLRRRLEGRELSRSEAYALMEEPWEDIGGSLMRCASLLRDRAKGRRISYSRKVFLPLTNLCRDFCSYCTYRRAPWEEGAKTYSVEEAVEIARLGAKWGCTEALLMTGERPEQRYDEYRSQLRRWGYSSTIEYLRDACEAIVRFTPLLPHSNPGTMSKKEMAELKPFNASLGMMLENVSERLCEQGGPHFMAPSKHPRARLATIEGAGQLRIPFTTGLLIGIGEEPEEVVDSLFALKELQERYGHLQEVIIQNFKAKPATPMKGREEPSLEYMLRVIALARIILGEEMNIQAPPNLGQDYALYLEAGINDWGGVSPITIDYVNPEALWPSIRALRRITEAGGFELRHRLPIYPEFIREEFLASPIKERILLAKDEEGYAKEGRLD